MRNVSYKYLEKFKTRIFCSITSSRKFCLYEIMWKNLYSLAGHRLQYGALHAGYLRLQTHPQKCNTYCFQLQQRLHGRILTLRYTYIVCLVITETGYVYCAVRAAPLSMLQFNFHFQRVQQSSVSTEEKMMTVPEHDLKLWKTECPVPLRIKLRSSSPRATRCIQLTATPVLYIFLIFH